VKRNGKKLNELDGPGIRGSGNNTKWPTAAKQLGKRIKRAKSCTGFA